MTRKRKTKHGPVAVIAEQMPDPDEVEKLAAAGCTPAEAAAWYGMTTAAFQRVLAQPVLRGVWLRGKRRGRARIRLAQYELAEKSMSMALHLGKHLLGQKGTEETGAGRVTLIVDTGIDRGDPPQD